MNGLINKVELSDWMLGLILISLLIVFLGNVQHFNFGEIFKNYFDIFRDLNGKINIFAVYFAVIFPLWLALYINDFLPENEVDFETELLIVTILTALFFSMFGIIFSLKDKLKSDNNQKMKSATEKVRLNKLVDSIFYINMFEITISVLILILCFVNDLLKGERILSVLIYYLLFTLLINMFIELKRIHVTMKEIMKN